MAVDEPAAGDLKQPLGHQSPDQGHDALALLAQRGDRVVEIEGDCLLQLSVEIGDGLQGVVLHVRSAADTLRQRPDARPMLLSHVRVRVDTQPRAPWLMELHHCVLHREQHTHRVVRRPFRRLRWLGGMRRLGHRDEAAQLAPHVVRRLRRQLVEPPVRSAEHEAALVQPVLYRAYDLTADDVAKPAERA